MKKIIETIKHKWADYLLEIIVIMVGILGAFGLNNWNEGQKDKKRENYYLAALKKEFLENKEVTQHGIEFHKTQIKNAQLVLAVITEDTALINLEELHFALLQTGWAWSGDFNNNVWSELINTGNVGLISNNPLREAITQFKSKARQMIIAEKEWMTFNLKYRETTGDVLPPKLRLSIGEALGHYQNQGKIEEPLLTQEQIEIKLNEIEGVNAILTDVIIVRRVGLEFLQDIAKYTEDILQKLDLE